MPPNGYFETDAEPAGMICQSGVKRLRILEIIIQLSAATGPGSAGKAVIRAFPNPFNSNLVFTIGLPDPDVVSMSIYNIEGRKVKDLILDIRLRAGENRVVWDGITDNGRKASSGVYFYVFRTSLKIERGKIYLLR